MPSKSKAQRNFMAAAAHNPAFAKKAGVPVSVAKEFNQADKGKKFREGGAMKHADVKMDKKTAKKAVGMHEEQLHGGKKSDMSKLKKGGKVKCMADGGSVEEREKQKKMYDAAEKMDKESYSPMDAMKRVLSPKKETAKPAPKKMAKGGTTKCMAKGGGIEVRGKTRGRMC
jgi:hypothetical protein